MKEKGIFWLLLILIIATILRTYQLQSTPPGLYPDEAMNGNNALHALATDDFKLYYPENNGREGLFINIQALFLKTFGATDPWVLRFPSTIIGILTVWGVYLLGKELFSRRVGLVSAFFIATSFWHIIFSRIGFRAIMAPFFLTWALYILIASIRKAEKSRGIYLLSSAIGGILFGLGFHTYISYRIAPLILLFFVPFFFKNRYFAKSIIVFLAAAFLAGLPLGIYYLNNPSDFLGRTSQISVFSSQNPILDLGENILKTLGMLNFQGDGNWRHNYAGRPELFWPVGILFLVGIAIGVFFLLKRKGGGIVPVDKEAEELEDWESLKNLKFGFAILFSWFLLGFAPVVISNEGIPHALRSILIIPPVFLFAGVGAIFAHSFLRKHLKSSFVLPLAYSLLALLFVYEAAQTYFIIWGKDPRVASSFNASYVEVGNIINSISKQAPKYVVIEAGGTLIPVKDAFSDDVRDLPVPAQTVMFVTNTFEPEGQKEKNVHYVLPGEEPQTPALKFYLK